MKDILKSQLESYKKYNTKSSKEEMLATMNSITNSMSDNDSSAISSVEAAKKALRASNNKDKIVQTVESVISSLS